MSTKRIYTRAELEQAVGGACDGRMSPQRHPQELLDIVARHAEARGETLSAFLRRAMVRTLHADMVSMMSLQVRQVTTEQVFEEWPDNWPTANYEDAETTKDAKVANEERGS